LAIGQSVCSPGMLEKLKLYLICIDRVWILGLVEQLGLPRTAELQARGWAWLWMQYG